MRHSMRLGCSLNTIGSRMSPLCSCPPSKANLNLCWVVTWNLWTGLRTGLGLFPGTMLESFSVVASNDMQGTGGHMLGGSISNVSSHHQWACDSWRANWGGGLEVWRCTCSYRYLHFLGLPRLRCALDIPSRCFCKPAVLKLRPCLCLLVKNSSCWRAGLNILCSLKAKQTFNSPLDSFLRLGELDWLGQLNCFVY